MRNISRKRWSSSLEIFSALKHFALLQPDIDKACDLIQRQQLNGIMQKLQQTVRFFFKIIFLSTIMLYVYNF